MNGLGIDGNGNVFNRNAWSGNVEKKSTTSDIKIDFTKPAEKSTTANGLEALGYQNMGLHLTNAIVAERIEKSMLTLGEFNLAFNPKPNNEELVNGFQDYRNMLPPVTKEEEDRIIQHALLFGQYEDIPEFQAIKKTV